VRVGGAVDRRGGGARREEGGGGGFHGGRGKPGGGGKVGVGGVGQASEGGGMGGSLLQASVSYSSYTYTADFAIIQITFWHMTAVMFSIDEMKTR
jgi:hypothetical protein